VASSCPSDRLKALSRLFCCAVLLPAPAAAQSLLDRPPNLTGGWVVGSGTLQFNFLHRFHQSPAPERKIGNSPTFLMAIGLPHRVMAGFTYATNSTLSPRYPNEWEFMARVALLRELEGAPLDLSAQAGYNLSAEGVDAELSVGKKLGPVRLLAAGRSLKDPLASGRELAAAGGILVRLSRFLSIGGDLATVFDRPDDSEEEAAWSAGLNVAIPNTPHTLSLHASNANTSTLQGMSRGGGTTRYGFEFTIPVTLARYFGSRPAPAAAPAPPPSEASGPAGRDTVRAAMKNLAFLPGKLQIAAGTTVAWTNDDPLDHTVLAEDRSFDSGLIRSGAVWHRTFTVPGTYTLTCTPHPFMKMTVVVTGGR
jgi:plastocyanin